VENPVSPVQEMTTVAPQNLSDSEDLKHLFTVTTTTQTISAALPTPDLRAFLKKLEPTQTGVFQMVIMSFYIIHNNYN
jgi:hypothetical protein